MRKNYALYIGLFIALISISTLSSCRFGSIKGSGHRITETRKVDDFSRIDISGGYEVKLRQDSSLSVSITADDNLMKHIRTQAAGGKLRIYSNKGIQSSGPLEVTIGVRNLDEIQVSGAVDITGEGRINTGDFKLKLTGAGKVNLDLSAANVVSEGTGATEIYLKGQAAAHKVNLTGAGKLNAVDFVVSDYDIKTSGASHCEINVLKSLNVNSSGASEVKYRGNPSNISNHKSGASSIVKIN